MKVINIFFVALIALTTGFLSEGARAAEKQTLQNHEIVTWKPGDKVEIFVPEEFIKNLQSWKKIRNTKNSKKILEDKNTTIHFVLPLAKESRDFSHQSYYAQNCVLYVVGRYLVEAPANDMLQFLDIVNNLEESDTTPAKFARIKGWGLSEIPDIIQKKAQEKGINSDQYMKEIEQKYVREPDKKFMRIAKELQKEGIEITPSDNEPLRYPVFVNGKPAPYLFYDMENSQ